MWTNTAAAVRGFLTCRARSPNKCVLLRIPQPFMLPGGLDIGCCSLCRVLFLLHLLGSPCSSSLHWFELAADACGGVWRPWPYAFDTVGRRKRRLMC